MTTKHEFAAAAESTDDRLVVMESRRRMLRPLRILGFFFLGLPVLSDVLEGKPLGTLRLVTIALFAFWIAGVLVLPRSQLAVIDASGVIMRKGRMRLPWEHMDRIEVAPANHGARWSRWMYGGDTLVRFVPRSDVAISELDRTARFSNGYWGSPFVIMTFMSDQSPTSITRACRQFTDVPINHLT